MFRIAGPIGRLDLDERVAHLAALGRAVSDMPSVAYLDHRPEGGPIRATDDPKDEWTHD